MRPAKTLTLLRLATLSEIGLIGSVTANRVVNVRHSHVNLTIRNTHIFSKHIKLIRVSRIHYIAKNGKAQLPLIGYQGPNTDKSNV